MNNHVNVVRDINCYCSLLIHVKHKADGLFVKLFIKVNYNMTGVTARYL